MDKKNDVMTTIKEDECFWNIFMKKSEKCSILSPKKKKIMVKI